MLTNNLIKYTRSLKDKKDRDQHKTFVAEGNKMVTDLIGALRCQYLIGTKEALAPLTVNNIEHVVEIKEADMKRISLQKSPQQLLAIFYQPQYTNVLALENKLTIVLDEIQDPGNLGTIVRLADWYGIENIVCSPHTADIYNPKTVQATMGALARVRVHYMELVPFFRENKEITIYGAFLDGDDIYRSQLSDNGIIVMGNEGKGVSKEVENYVSKRLFIPSYPPNVETSESLNVAIATAIVCAEFRRRML